jgi:VanZ family protein
LLRVKQVYKVQWRVAVAAWIALIFYSSTSQAGRISEQAFTYLTSSIRHRADPGHFAIFHFIADKSVHVSLFCILAILLWRAFRSPTLKPLKIIAFGAVIGSCSELLQRLFPDRDPAIRDVLINVGGTCLGLAISLAVLKWQRLHQDFPPRVNEVAEKGV